MISTVWQELVSRNPMLIEITRFRRRYLSFSGSNSVNGVVLSLILICYATLVLVVAENRNSVSPIQLITFETGLFTVFAPMMLYTAIAGERERRSWDLLLAAPITKSQIVVGKFIGAMAALGVGVLMFQLPIMIAAFSYEAAHWQTVVMASIESVSFLMCVCALTLLFSARVKRGLMALGATLGTLVTFFIVLPGFAAVGASDRNMQDVTFFLHPFYVLSRISSLDIPIAQTYSSMRYSGSPASSPTPQYYLTSFSYWWGVPQSLVYLGFTAVLLTWASQTLSFAENEVKFLPQGQKDA